MSAWPRRLVSLPLLAVMLVNGCAPTLERHVRTPERLDEISPKRSPFLNLHLRDGGFVSLRQWSVDSSGTRVSGVGQLLGPDRAPLAAGAISVPVDSVALVEAASTEGMPPALQAVTIVLVGAALVAVAGLAALAIFGSCPTFYVTDGHDPTLMAEGFSASIAPILEAADLDALWRARPRGRTLEVTMKNEALETHVVRWVRVIAAPRPPGGRVIATASGELWQATALAAPLAARGPEGDCRASLSAIDGIDRASEPDSADLAARETLDLEFPATAGRVGLVLASRQTLLTTYLFYETLDAMGGSAGRWLAALERGDRETGARATALGRELGGIEVLVPDGADGWRRVEEVNETGPLATDVKLVPLPDPGDGPVRVRLRAARGLFRLDGTLLARLGARVEARPLEPVEVRRAGVRDDAARAALLDPARTLVTSPGDVYTLVYRLPGEASGLELFLQSRGYYLEWMRERWIQSEDPARVATLLFAPRRALRELAPAYAREHAAVEDWFWRSRDVHP